MMKQDPQFGGVLGELVPPETKHPLKILEEARRNEEKSLEFARQASAAQEQQAEDTNETKTKLITPIKRFEQHGARMYAESGIHAMRRTRDTNNPVVVARSE